MSILDGVDERIDEFFMQICGDIRNIGERSPHYKSITSAQRLSGEHTSTPRFGAVLEDIIGLIKSNWDKGGKREPTEANWRFTQRPNIDPDNRNPETIREREMVATKDNGWGNQCPTASNLYDGEQDQHRNVDLIHEVGDAEYEFVELKVESDTPLRAAMEIVEYAALYVFARRQFPGSDKELLKAKAIHLKVLAPTPYYTRYDFEWLQKSLDEGLKEVRDVCLDFEFLAYSEDFSEQDWSAGGPLDKMKGIAKPNWRSSN